MENFLQKDKEFLVFLNNIGSEQWDSFWLFITNQFNWIPLFIFIFYLVIKKFGWKKGSIVMLTLIVLVTFSDQFTNLIKDTIQRLRPNNDPAISNSLRKLIHPQGYSFISGHATTSTFFIMYIVLLLRKTYAYIWLLFLFPLIFAYSRLYLGVHFPVDIVCGIFMGIILGNLYYLLIKKIAAKKLFID
ncbi:MAG: phosphatase PAP2 family protein [Flavobacteriaceae bacterium]|nr:MAG: phosphatase PAP2 family protein [Flavobacteriaceae bacterium]